MDTLLSTTPTTYTTSTTPTTHIIRLQVFVAPTDVDVTYCVHWVPSAALYGTCSMRSKG